MPRAPLPENLSTTMDRVVKYLLNLDHPRGGSKARFFLSFGFSPERPIEFAQALFDAAVLAEIWEEQAAPPGLRRFACKHQIWTPNGERPWVKTVWQVDLDEDGRLLTAHPIRAPKP